MKRKRSAIKPQTPVKRPSRGPLLLMAVIAIMAVAAASAYLLMPKNPVQPPLYVGIVDQFYSKSPEFTDRAVALLSKHNVSYGLHTDSDVNVSLYRNLPSYGYNLIVLRVHAGINQGIGGAVFLFTAEPFSQYRYVYEVNTSQLAPGMISLEGPEGMLFTVGPQFVKRSMQGDFNGATLVLSSCYGLNNTVLADALRQKGALHVIAWDGLVSLDQTDRAILELLSNIVEGGLSPGEALAALDDGAKKDPYYGSTLKIYPPVK